MGFAWFIGGMVLFPDAPIHQCGLGYCGKQGQAHTKQDFEAFQLWENFMMVGWPFVVVSLGWLGRQSLVGKHPASTPRPKS